MLQRDEKGHGLDEVRCQFGQQQPALGECFVHEFEVQHLQVAQATVHQLRGPLGRSRGPVLAFDDCGTQPPRRGVKGDTRAGDSTSDDEHIELGPFVATVGKVGEGLLA